MSREGVSPHPGSGTGCSRHGCLEDQGADRAMFSPPRWKIALPEERTREERAKGKRIQGAGGAEPETMQPGGEEEGGEEESVEMAEVGRLRAQLREFQRRLEMEEER